MGRPVWESRRLLDGVSSTEALSPLDEFVRDRAGKSLAHVFTLLALVLPREPLQIAFRSLQTDDQHLHGTALEYLDGILPPAIRERLWPFLEAAPARRSTRPRDEVMAELLRSHRSITLNLEELYQRGAGPARRRRPRHCHDTCTESHRAARARGGPQPDHDRPACPTTCSTEQMRRLRLCAAVAMGLWTFGLVMDAFVRPGTVGVAVPRVHAGDRGRGDCRSRRCSSPTCASRTHPPRIQAHAGLVFMVLNAMGVGLLNTWARPLTDDALNELSWNTIVILCGAMLMPATPKQMLVAALLAASMDPLGHRRRRPARPRGALGDAHARAVPAELRLRRWRRWCP